MNDITNPPRLFETNEAPAELRAWLRHAHDDAPSRADIEQLVRAVEERVGPGAPALAFTKLAPLKAVSTLHLSKPVLVASVMALGLGAGTWYLGHARHDHDPRSSMVVPESSSGPAEEPSERPQPVVQPAAVSPADVRPVMRAAANPATTGADEYHLLRAAQQALADRPARALALTNEHKRRFAAGMLAQEREAIAVDALVELNQAKSAKTRARTFLAVYPNSPYRSRIERSLGHSANVANQR